jgi:GNAT superfamily N-acetyltransferase
MTREDRLIVRMFQKADLLPLESLIHRTIAACYPPYYGPEAVRFFLEYHSGQAIGADAHEGRTLVLDKAGRVLGTGTLVGDEIKRVFVDPSFQRQGMGRLLMQRLEETALAAAIPIVTLDASLPAKAFYDRLGYVTVEKASRPVAGGRQLDYFKMQKVLSTSLK